MLADPWSRTVHQAPLTAVFYGDGRKPECRPNPDYPDGLPVDMSDPGFPSCGIDLIHPAPCIGTWLLKCAICGRSVGVTAAGRPDDPSEVRLPCKARGEA